MRKFLNRTRQLYHKVLAGRRPSETRLNEAIAAAYDFKSLKQHPGWERIEAWLGRQREAHGQYLQHEVGNVNAVSVLRLFNTFVKYLFFLMENRAYTKIENFVTMSIQKGEEYARRQAKKEEAENRKSE